MAVFLPDGTQATVGGGALIAPLLAQAAAQGSSASFEEHAQRLAASSPYAGSWSLVSVPDGITAQQALYLIRHRKAVQILKG